jgi:hypothetical protein
VIYLSNLLQFTSRPFANFWRRYPKGIDNPFNTSGCKYLFFVCRCCLRSVAWFSYWFDNLSLITEGNTYRCCAASSLPLWGNTDVVQANIRLRTDGLMSSRFWTYRMLSRQFRSIRLLSSLFHQVGLLSMWCNWLSPRYFSGRHPNWLCIFSSCRPCHWLL